MTALQEIAALADIPIEVEIELARKTISLRDILGLNPGSVIKLPRSAGENIDILAGGVLLGSGEIVIIEDTVGVRITDFRDSEL
jgi:flagellar motor switch protein FliN/FliY